MTFFSIVRDAANFLWGPPMLIFLLGSGLYLTLRFKLIQFTNFFSAVKELKNSATSTGDGNITPFQALMTVLSGIVGNGNIAGVATAIVVGGPGAIFWMWISALVLMAVMYAESLLGCKFREKDEDGIFLGGPMVYIQKGLGWRWLAIAFAIAMAIKTLLATTSIQSNSMAIVLQDQFNIPLLLSCGIIAVLTWMVIIGGLKWIAKTAQVLVPFMTVAYLGFGIIILILNYDKLPAVLNEIIAYAFTTKGAVGGFSGATVMMALRYGAARGAYSNEAGTGSAAILYATAQSDNPKKQALVAMLGVFIDTIVVCSLTAFIILLSGLWTQDLNSTALVSESFQSNLSIGSWIVLLASLLFGYSTLITWCFYGEQSAAFIFGDKIKIPYRWLFCLSIFIGANSNPENIWSWGDLLNAITVIINLIGILALSAVAVKATFRE
jgi:alanine or glycine:cation symporter, AGCS family